jgi:hypothetical protein
MTFGAFFGITLRQDKEKPPAKAGGFQTLILSYAAVHPNKKGRPTSMVVVGSPVILRFGV